MKIAFKWCINAAKTAYIEDEYNNGPFIYNKEDGKRTYYKLDTTNSVLTASLLTSGGLMLSSIVNDEEIETPSASETVTTSFADITDSENTESASSIEVTTTTTIIPEPESVTTTTTIAPEPVTTTTTIAPEPVTTTTTTVEPVTTTTTTETGETTTTTESSEDDEPDEATISFNVSKLDYDTYGELFEELKELVKSDDDGKILNFLPLDYYYHMETSCYDNNGLEIYVDYNVITETIKSYNSDGEENEADVDIAMYGNDEKQTVSFLFTIPRGKAGYSCEFSTDNAVFTKDEVISGKGTTEMAIEIFLSNEKRLTPDSVTFALASGSKASISYDKEEDPNIFYINPYSGTSAKDETNLDTIVNVTVKHGAYTISKKIYVKVVDINMTGTKEYDEYVSKVIESYSSFTRTLQNLSTSAETLFQQTVDGFNITAKNYKTSAETEFKTTSNSIQLAATNFKTSAESLYTQTASNIDTIVADKIQGEYTKVSQVASAITEDLENLQSGYSNTMELTAEGFTETVRDAKGEIQQKTRETASSYEKTITDYKNSAETVYEQTVSGFSSYATALSGDLQSRFVQTAGSFEATVENRISGYVSDVQMTAEQIQMSATTASGMCGAITVTASEIGQKVGTLSGYSEIMQEMSGITIRVESLSGRVSEISVTTSGITASAENIKLEGYVSINDGFSVDLEGNVTMNNATVNGNLKTSLDDLSIVDTGQESPYTLDITFDDNAYTSTGDYYTVENTSKKKLYCGCNATSSASTSICQNYLFLEDTLNIYNDYSKAGTYTRKVKRKCSYNRIMLPNDPDYIGAHIMINCDLSKYYNDSLFMESYVNGDYTSEFYTDIVAGISFSKRMIYAIEDPRLAEKIEYDSFTATTDAITIDVIDNIKKKIATPTEVFTARTTNSETWYKVHMSELTNNNVDLFGNTIVNTGKEAYTQANLIRLTEGTIELIAIPYCTVALNKYKFKIENGEPVLNNNELVLDTDEYENAQLDDLYKKRYYMFYTNDGAKLYKKSGDESSDRYYIDDDDDSKVKKCKYNHLMGYYEKTEETAEIDTDNIYDKYGFGANQFNFLKLAKWVVIHKETPNENTIRYYYTNY